MFLISPVGTTLRGTMRFPDGRSLLRSVRVGGGASDLFWRTEIGAPSGAEVRLDVRVGSDSPCFSLCGHVVETCIPHLAHLRGGVWVRMEGSRAWPFAAAMAWAAGRPMSWGRRAAPRRRVDLPIALQRRMTKETARVLDLSRRGARLRVANTAGMSPVLTMTVPVSLGQRDSLDARLIWRDPSRHEIGIQFTEISRGAMSWLIGNIHLGDDRQRPRQALAS